jgi:hypothetical protein
MGWSRVLAGLVAVLFAIQLVPVSRTNPPVQAAVQAPPEVMTILRKACFDCHSNETVWPVQAYVAPLSWYVAHDVKEGREELNFSAWSPERARKAAKKFAEEVRKGDMPPALYVLAHPGAKLTNDERALLVNWAQGLGSSGP